MCFIVNTYAVIVHERRGVFKRPVKFHFMQSVFSWLGPAGIVLGCLFISPPGYRFVFADLLAAGTDSVQMAYFAFTLPMQVSLGVSLCLLWSIVWCLRKVVKLFLVTCLTFHCPVKHDTIVTKTRYGERTHWRKKIKNGQKHSLNPGPITNPIDYFYVLYALFISRSQSSVFRFAFSIFCVSSVTNRVIVRTLERDSKGNEIDLFSLYVLFSQYRSRDNTLENCFFQIYSSYSRAYVRIIYEKKGSSSPGTSIGKTKHASLRSEDYSLVPTFSTNSRWNACLATYVLHRKNIQHFTFVISLT